MMSTSNISLPSESSAPVWANICANDPEVSPRIYKPSLISLPLAAVGVDVVTSPVKSVLRKFVFKRNLGRLTTTFGRFIKPVPPSVTVIPWTTPPTTSAVPNAPVPPPPTTRTETKPYPEPPDNTCILLTEKVNENSAFEPNVDPPEELVAVVVTIR